MTDSATLQRCFAYVETQLGTPSRTRRLLHPPTITLSRQTGSGGLPIAQRLAAYLQEHRPGLRAAWTVFDRDLVQRVLLEHRLPARLAEYMPEDRVSYIQDTLEELVGLHPSSDTLVAGMTETILGLAELGNCIIVGRGANVILGRHLSAFHIRLISDLEKRVVRVQEDKGMTADQAREFIRREDTARERYVRDHFNADLSDPLGYHLTLNTERFTIDEAAELLGRAIVQHFPEPFRQRVEHHIG